MKWPVFACLVFFLLPSPVRAEDTIKTGPGVTTELWEGKVLTASFKTGMCFRPDGEAYGVLILRHASGDEDIYHLKGSIKNNHFQLAHSSGHSFTGKLTGPHSMEGNVKLASGLSLGLSGKRTQDVPLVAKDCAPLQK